MGFRISNEELNKIVSKAKEIYNRYRSPEAAAEVVEVRGDEVIIKFKGTFCETCGLYDWIEDMSYILKDLGVDAVVTKAEEVGERTYVGIFRIRNVRGKHK